MAPARSVKRENTPSVSAAPKSLTQLAYEQIKGRILSMELRPGQFLNEATLCQLLDLGRMPVHQAIHRLQAEGLLEVIPRKGLVVRAESLHDILELLEARMAMEPNIAALAAERISAEQVAHLRKLLAQSRAHVHQSQRAAFRDLDRAFHLTVGEGAGNRSLAAVLRPLHERSDLIWHLRIMPQDGLKVTQKEHEAVLKAIVRRDSQGARDAMQAHLVSLYQRVLAATLNAGHPTASFPAPVEPFGRSYVPTSTKDRS